MKTLAIIPARAGSKRIKHKNIKPFLDVPLIAWTLHFARSYHHFDTVHISTDEQKIADLCQNYGFDVPRLRPSHLATDTSTSVDMAIDALTFEEEKQKTSFDAVALLQPTTPLRLDTYWNEAYQIMLEETVKATIGLTPVKDHPCHMFTHNKTDPIKPLYRSQNIETRTQDLKTITKISGGLYWVKAKTLKDQKTFFPDETHPIIMKEDELAIDLDTENEWIMAEALFRFQKVPTPNFYFK